MVTLGLGSSRSHVIERVLKGIRTEKEDINRRARNKKLVGRKIFGAVIGKGYLHDLYYLTDHGAKFVASYHGKKLEQIVFPTSGEPQFMRDYFHRVLFVDCHIQLVSWAKRSHLKINCFLRYFNQTMGRVADTRCEVGEAEQLIPDGLILVSDRSGKKSLYILEVHQCNRQPEVTKQITRHIEAAGKGVYHELFPEASLVYVLSVTKDKWRTITCGLKKS